MAKTSWVSVGPSVDLESGVHNDSVRIYNTNIKSTLQMRDFWKMKTHLATQLQIFCILVPTNNIQGLLAQPHQQ